MGVNAAARRELLGLNVDDSKPEAFWCDSFGSHKERGISSVQLLISYYH